MSKAVFTHKPASIYDDDPEVRYHFPQTYLRQVESAIGDLIVYYEPGRNGLDDRERTGRRAYVAVARVGHIDRDLLEADRKISWVISVACGSVWLRIETEAQDGVD